MLCFDTGEGMGISKGKNLLCALGRIFCWCAIEMQTIFGKEFEMHGRVVKAEGMNDAEDMAPFSFPFFEKFLTRGKIIKKIGNSNFRAMRMGNFSDCFLGAASNFYLCGDGCIGSACGKRDA